tara:strand:+ start:104601 stop:106037 length:1437 start_codon:yes stop_codon:yes gene_type:complete
MGIIFLGRIAQALLALIGLRIVTTLLSPEEMGRLSLLLAVTSFFVLGLVNPVGMFINRRLHFWVETGRIIQYLKLYVMYLIGVSVFSVLLLYLLNFYYVAVPGIPLVWMLGLVASSIVFLTLNQTYIPSLNMLGQRGWFVSLTLAGVIFSLFLSVVFIYSIEARGELWQAGQIIGQLLIGLAGACVFFRLAKEHKKVDSSRKSMTITCSKLLAVTAFCWPLGVSVLLTWIQTQSYRFLIQDSVGLAALGLFVVGYGVSASLIGIFESIISTYFIPVFYKRTATEDKYEQAMAWRAYVLAMLSSTIVLVSVIVVISDEFARVLLDEKYISASKYILWGALAEASRVIVGAYALLAHAGMNTKKLILPNVIGAITAPLSIILFVRYFGVEGVGMGLVLAGFMAIISSHIVLSKSFEIMMPWSNIFWACLVALILILTAEIGYIIFGPSETFLISFIWLSVSGLVLLFILFLMLSPQIKNR